MHTIDVDPGIYVINERVVSEDTLAVAGDGHVFPGGYVAILTYHTYSGPWTDDENVRRFRSLDAADKFIVKRYGKTFYDLVFGVDPYDEQVDAVLASYVATALWSSTNDEGVPLDTDHGPDDIDPDTLAEMREDVIGFLALLTREGLTEHADFPDAAQVGHDLWLTRNRHGAGFWDRGLGQLGDDLTKWAHTFDGVDLYVGDDNLIHHQS